ncbi:hypothetical protein [Polymorphum gilvum]|uniref:Uncharacterized protein n=1 Tax=Polymorphum gilvum (strain LMG 25793 / CGMCC 1.9160 / SL003B-26A1) TaxID=991905 RepID=F2J419_POLGS|nr:hypothetical protein [Polymorphum gilvum]ADZ69945.1 hypothetical protein SL003B_1517 [Polymorphum gilvum SL003B-26A1]
MARPVSDRRASPCRGKVAAAAALACAIQILTAAPGQGTGSDRSRQVQGEYEVGWVNDAQGMRHYSGLSCPNRVGTMTRTKVLAATDRRAAGCVYAGDGSFQAVVRQHVKGTGRSDATAFAERYRAAGLEQVTMTGISGSGVTFRMGDGDGRTTCETLWHLSGASADYTLWFSYSLPEHGTAVAPAFEAFQNTLARQN